MTDETGRVPLNRTERVLATMIASVGGLSLLAMIAVMIATMAGETEFGGLWPFVRVLPLVGLPIAFALIVVFMVVALIRRRRIEPDGRR